MNDEQRSAILRLEESLRSPRKIGGWLAACFSAPSRMSFDRRAVYQKRDSRSMRTITLEEHFATPRFLAGPGRSFLERAATMGDRMSQILEKVRDVDAGRIAEMDAAGID